MSLNSFLKITANIFNNDERLVFAFKSLVQYKVGGASPDRVRSTVENCLPAHKLVSILFTPKPVCQQINQCGQDCPTGPKGEDFVITSIHNGT